MKVEEVQHDSGPYEEMVVLRKQILRDPLGLSWTEEEQSWERQERHFALRDGSLLLACVVIRPLDHGAVKLRQMAVESSRQGSGLGRRLLEGVEERLRADGILRVELNARETAVGFYGKLGYRKIGGRFMEVTLPHWKMVKAL